MNTTESTEAACPTMPEMPLPTQEHAWLQRLTGDWISEVEFCCAPGQSIKTTGSEHARMLGGFWFVTESASDSTEMPFSSIFSVGYDPVKGKYIGTWIDTMLSKLWTYEGDVNELGTVLTLNATGSCPHEPGRVRQFRERIELVDKDHKVFTSSILEEDGSWTTCVTVQSRRK